MSLLLLRQFVAKYFGQTSAQDAICSLSFPIVLYAKHHLSRTKDTYNQTARHSLQNNGKCDYKYLSFFFLAWNFFPSLQNLRCDAEQVSKKTNLPSDLRAIAANKGFFVSDNQATGNCLFHTLSEQLQSVKGIQISHEELRKTLVQFLDENPNRVG